ncbi:MAG TPA: outer membrane beta-barrel family protein [Bacteroidales bacterium]|nr:outer membrane beta-barrel family protein [Bacteroidales bacterium]
MKRSVFIALVLFFAVFVAQAQDKPGPKNGNGNSFKGSVTGIVFDKKTNTPVEFANVIVCKNSDSSMVTGALTNSKGRFSIDNVPYGKYYIKINFIGYGPQTISNISINDDNTYLNIHTVYLETTATNLDAVTISGQKDQVEYNLDKKVINVDKNLLTSGGTALDIMQTIPSVDVDIEGNVSLRGSQNVTIFIDGRPSGLTSLDQMPASMIEKVEIVTNPSARYDPDGMSGIINIVTKRRREAGYNAMVSANAGTGGKYSSSVNLGYNLKKFSIYTNLDFRRNGMKTYYDSYRELFDKDTAYVYKQLSSSKRKGFFGNFKLGADYFINDKNTLSVYGEYNVRRFNPYDTTGYFNYDYNDLLSNYYNRQNNTKGSHGGYELGLDYKKEFRKKNQELLVSFFYSNSPSLTVNELTTDYYNVDLTPGNTPSLVQKNFSDNLFRRFYGQLDYVHPMDKWGRIETGYKIQFRFNNQNYKSYKQFPIVDSWDYDEIASNAYNYSEQLHSAYLIYANSIKKFKFQAGLRAEQVLTIMDQKTMDSTYKSNYFNLFPTVHLKYEFNDKHAVQISYSRRVNRPRSGNLNPFINNSDPMNLSAGNPYLKPEFTNSFELGHLISFKETSFNTTLFYRETDNMVTRVLNILDSGVTISTYKNLDKGSSFGLELIYTQGIFKWWKINANFSLFGTKYFGTSEVDGFNDVHPSWTAKINSSMTFWKSFDVQLGFNYRSAHITAQSRGDFRMGVGTPDLQGRQLANYTFDVGLKKDFLKKSLILTLRVSDIFKTNKSQTITEASDYYANIRRWSDSRVLYLGVSYRINKGIKARKKIQHQDENLDDQEY